MDRYFFLFAFWLLITGLAHAQDTATPTALPPLPGYDQGMDRISVLQQANEFYKQGQYEDALQGYLHLTQLGVANGYLFYNIGNTYFRLGQLGPAILWYERARLYLPRSEDLKVNYNYARQQLADDEFQAPAHTGTIGFLIHLHNSFTLRETVWQTLAFFWLLILAIIAFLFIPHENWKNWLRIPCWISLVCVTLLFFSLGIKLYQFTSLHEAIVMAPVVEVRTGPGNDLSVLFSIHEGTKVAVIQQQGAWQRIVLPGNKTYTGWLPKETIAEI
ncbi:MAG: hypothetical protein RBU29_12165 [bacterium]|jgi:tetratricopeptide (TPR) repeat protein|nr:hypothetical protein [bacterium]